MRMSVLNTPRPASNRPRNPSSGGKEGTMITVLITVVVVMSVTITITVRVKRR